ncbi:hypothetical protein [Peribacillus sp. SCS-155]|uniref:hypothetical protein n=1 Tax=Peribacillus sedimenti TaxID=3115297 RepID=UPI00390601CD
MSGLLNNMASKAKTTLDRATVNLKGKLFDLTGTPSTSVQELADFIKGHPETKVITRNLLGLTFSFYSLETEDLSYYLEQKGPHILGLEVKSNQQSIVSYRSYRDTYPLNSPIKFSV